MLDTETTRTCECGKDFTPTHWKQAYCCKQHAQHAYNARYRGHEPTWEIVDSFDCAQCDKHCVPGENVAPHASRFCGSGCKGKWHAKHNPSVVSDEVKAQRRKAARHNAARMKLKRAACLPSSGTGFTAGPCASPSCPQVFVSRQCQARYCSELCSRRESRKIQRAKHGRMDSARKRARRFGVEYEPVSKSHIFERDDYQCGICGGQTDPTADPQHAAYPTLDHVIPISKGGGHIYLNLQCAHRGCNTTKSSRIDIESCTEQLTGVIEREAPQLGSGLASLIVHSASHREEIEVLLGEAV